MEEKVQKRLLDHRIFQSFLKMAMADVKMVEVRQSRFILEEINEDERFQQVTSQAKTPATSSMLKTACVKSSRVSIVLVARRCHAGGSLSSL